ncbi:hypothetical protein EUGRSUZ_K03224 [Eucalyptus grandis]|uniref:Uncharacterized protein n=2 Tax=Eucalyptus grandis TaxID=71139 RepID=A0ACC3IZ93_EUCGR|nr:hypothetical protein EUGRSUZ_K03224 [Eucalyptus grandis]
MVSLCSLSYFFLSLSFVFLSQFSNFIDDQAQDYDCPTATISTQWVNNAKATHVTRHVDGSIVRAILLRGKGGSGPAYAYGFYCNGTCNTYLFAVFIVTVYGSGVTIEYIIGVTLELAFECDLVLKDTDGMVAWSTDTSEKSVVGLNLTDLENLASFDKENVIVWQSFDEPTNLLVLGQKLRWGQILMSSVSKKNWIINDMISLSMIGDVLCAQVETNPPQIYFEREGSTTNASIEFPYVEFVGGSLFWISDSKFFVLMSFPLRSSTQYMKLGSDGHLRVYEYNWYGEHKEVADLFTVCGRYGICSNGQCSYPTSIGGTSYFQQVDNRQPNFGCFENVPLSSGTSKNQSLRELENVTYFSFTPKLENIDALSCKEVYAKNCSYKAAIFWSHSDRTSASCYLPTQVFSLMNIDEKMFSYNSAAYLKVQNVANKAPYTPVDNRMSNHLPVILGSSLGALFAMMIFIVAIVLFVKKSFLAEVETINTHHVNLVRLLGFCVEKSHRLLIYDYMSNGSLDRWIFHKSNESKGLNYLHEDCRHKIFHLDIKSPNILLAGNFNAKVADFGLSKLIDKDKSHVVTTMKGTPGYVALSDHTKRPSMSMVIKVLYGVMEVLEDLDYDFTAQASTSGEGRFSWMDVEFNATTISLSSVLGGP